MKNHRNRKLNFRFIIRLMFAVCVLALPVAAQTVTDYTRYVNPFIGTGGHGHTFPGATVPHGAVQLSPDTRIDNWDGSSGYHYSDNTIFGFSHTHLSGTGIPDYCDVLLMPTIGDENLKNYASTFSHANEKAEPGYYAVKIDNGVFAEMTTTARVGFHRYTFPKTDEANIVVDLNWRDKVLEAKLKTVGNNRIEGFRRSSSWAKNQIIYFVAEFSKPYERLVSAPDEMTMRSGADIKKAFRFKTAEGEQILVKVGISAVSIEGARKNLATEIKDWNFDRVRSGAKAAWNKELAQIEVSGGTEAEMTNFYTALYHTKIQPNVFQDVDGNYLGLDGKIHNAAKDTNYTIFSLWDTFRAAHPLYTIIDQKRTVDYINTFIRQYEQGGRLPVWELAGNETDCMIGYHSVSVIADAMAKGIKGFDYEKVYKAAKHSAELNHFGLEAYKRRGYISAEDENESVSKTLEYAYDDWCIAQMAKILRGRRLLETKDRKFVTGFDIKYGEGKENDYQYFLSRARSFENLFDSSTGFMRPKKNGGFVAPFAPQEVTFNFTEGNSWVYSFFVPQDVPRLMQMYGGKKNFAAKLDELFTTNVKLSGREQPDITGLIGQYAHGNEPSHHIAYLYNFAGEPQKTQSYVHKILTEFYKPAPDGLIGNEDCGQMSAWYILSASGFYQIAPGRAEYTIGTPLFKEVKFHLENGKTFTVKAPQTSDKNIYVKSAKINGIQHDRLFFDHSVIANGGTLELEMTDVPANQWSSENIAPIAERYTAVPTIEATRVFNRETSVKIVSPETNAKIFYTLDNSEPSIKSFVYSKPFTIAESKIIRAVAVGADGAKSFPVEAKLHKMPHDWTVKIFSKYNRQYTGGGDEGLIDGIRGSLNFASGEWQGYQPQDFVAVIDLQRQTEIRNLGAGFLQNARSWIWMPTRITFEISDDNANFRQVADIKTDVAPDDMKEQIKDYRQNITPTKARYVRVHAYNLGKIPAWHPGAGDDAFIFVDEIFIN